MRVILAFIILFPALTFSQVRKYSNDFMSIGTSARARGMSNAVVASQKDVFAAYWNPANLTQINKNYEIGGLHADYFAGSAGYDYVGAAAKTEDGVLAVSFLRYGVDDIPNTLNLIGPDGQVDYSRITFFSTSDNVFMVSYATDSKIEGLSLGGSAKVVYRQLGDFAQSWGFGIDFSSTYRSGFWSFAAVGKDITTTVNAWTYSLTDEEQAVLESTGNDLPQDDIEITAPSLILGAARSIPIGRNFELVPEIDVECTFDGQRTTLIRSEFASINPRVGIETGFMNLVYLRMGVGNFNMVPARVGDYNTLQANGSIGIGLQLKDLFNAGNLSIDYALTNFSDSGSPFYSNVFSLQFAFGNEAQ